jgi:hypothetical protein
MSLFLPDLERALRRTIRARSQRRRAGATLRRRLAPAIAVAASVAVPVLVVTTVIYAGGSRVDRGKAAGPTPARSDSPFAAFRRAQISADTIPLPQREAFHQMFRREHADPGSSRAVFASPAETMWILPAVDHGKDAICLIAEHRQTAIVNCTHVTDTSAIFVLSQGGFHIDAVLPSRVASLRVTLSSGRPQVLTPTVDGAISRTFPARIRRITSLRH